MERTYDVFEVTEDGSLLWRDSVSGLEPALAKMHELAASSASGFRVMHLPSQSIVAVLDSKQPTQKSNGEERTKGDPETKLSLNSRKKRFKRVIAGNVSGRQSSSRR